MCNPTLAIATAAIAGGNIYKTGRYANPLRQAPLTRALRVSAKGDMKIKPVKFWTLRVKALRAKMSMTLCKQISRGCVMLLLPLGKVLPTPILASGSNNAIVKQSEADAYRTAAEDNLEKANLQSALDAFGQTLVDLNPLLADSAAAGNLASNFAKGSLGALGSEMQYAQTKAYNPLAQLLQTGGQIALGSYLAAPGTPVTPGTTDLAVSAGNTGVGAPVSVGTLPPLPYNPYTGTS